MSMHTVAGSAGRWAAFDLADGRPKDHTAYATYREAVMFAGKWDRDTTIYLLVQSDGMQPREAAAFLKYARFWHSIGGRLMEPETAAFDYTSQFGSALPREKSDRYKMARHLVSGGREFRNEGIAFNDHS
jgi:hypothetical protein